MNALGTGDADSNGIGQVRSLISQAGERSSLIGPSRLFYYAGECLFSCSLLKRKFIVAVRQKDLGR